MTQYKIDKEKNKWAIHNSHRLLGEKLSGFSSYENALKFLRELPELLKKPLKTAQPSQK